MARVCEECGKAAGIFSGGGFVEVEDRLLCGDCAAPKCDRCVNPIHNGAFEFIREEQVCLPCAGAIVDEARRSIVLTTTPQVDGYRIKSYIDIESVEVIAGTGIFSEVTGEIADFFGTRSRGFESKLQQSKRTALDKLKFLAYEKGGNAVVGVDLDYTEFSGNRVGLIANGTIVVIEPERKTPFPNSLNRI